MKLVKILGIASLALLATACSNNTSKTHEIHAGASLTAKEAEKLAASERDYELVIVHVNDVHGRAMDGSGGIGYARIATILDQVKADKANKKVIFLDAGDTFHGTNFATLERGESIAKILDEMGLLALSPGNHDFNYGHERLTQLNKMTKFEVLAANVKDSKGKLFTKPHMMIEASGKKIGIFGIATPETLYKTNPNNVKGLVFEDPAKASAKAVAELKAQGAEYIIALAHLGNDESSLPAVKSEAVANVPGVDLVIDGHSHTIENGKVGNSAPIFQTGEYGKNVGVLKIDFDSNNALTHKLIKMEEAVGKKGEDGKVTGGMPENESVKSFIGKIHEGQKVLTEKVIGKTAVKLDGERNDVRTGETNLSNLISDAILWKAKSDMAITNGGGIRASINEGNITVGNVLTVLPFGNYVITKQLSGADIKATLEHGFKDTPNAAGSQAQVAGVTFDVDTTKPAGQRISNIKFKNGKKFDLNGKYVVATNDFMAVGGDAYEMFKGKKDIANYPALDEIVIEYIGKNGITTPKVDPRAKVKK